MGFQKSCLCERNDKYEVCTQLSATSETFSYSDQSKVAIVILPLVTLEDQVEGEMTRLGLRYVNLTSTPAEALEEHIASVKPHVLIGNVESLTSADIQRKISWLKISYIAVDEAQVKFFCRNNLFLQYVSSKVADPERGWSFSPYSPELWRWLRATYQGVPFMLSSATLSTDSLERIKVSLGIDKDEVFVLSSSCDRPNIFQQCRRIPRKVDIW